MTTYTMHIPVTQVYLVDVEAGSPEEARAKGTMQLANDGLPPYSDEDGEPIDEQIQYDIIVVSWTDEETGKFCHTNVGKPQWATETEAELHATMHRAIGRMEIATEQTERAIENTRRLLKLLGETCRRILAGDDMREFARATLDRLDKHEE